MLNPFKIIGFIVLALVVAGVFAFWQFKKAMKYCYNINYKKTHVNTVGVNSIDFDLFVEFKNTSDISIDLTGYAFDVSLNGVLMTTVKNKTKVKLQAGALTGFSVNVNFSPKSLNKFTQSQFLQLVKNLAVDKSKVIFSMKGSVSAGLLGIAIDKVPLAFDFTLKDILTPSTTPQEVCK